MAMTVNTTGGNGQDRLARELRLSAVYRDGHRLGYGHQACDCS
jgi:hypothetical protein